ncbi:MAG: AtpZ/AtpI family protein [Candidatus Neomarinimicrobiota bacterium]
MESRKGSGKFIGQSFIYFQKMVQQAGPAAGAAYTLIAAILLFGLGGYFIDRKYETEPWFLLGGILLGLIIGFYELAKVTFKKK